MALWGELQARAEAPVKPVEAPPAQAEAPAKPAQAAKPAAPSKATAKPKCKSGMKPIPAGTFTMGDAENTEKAGTVTVVAFCMDRTEVTTAAYTKCVKSGKCTEAVSIQDGICHGGVTGDGNHPINCVNSGQATAYCEAQSQRLPTEEEWEYAARGTDGRIYPWGNAEPDGQLCSDRSGRDKPNNTCTVGNFPKGNSPFGLSDMEGNVSEWTSSAANASNTVFVIRGSNWTSGFWNSMGLHSACRSKSVGDLSYQDNTLGFRCAGSPLP